MEPRFSSRNNSFLLLAWDGERFKLQWSRDFHRGITFTSAGAVAATPRCFKLQWSRDFHRGITAEPHARGRARRRGFNGAAIFIAE